MVQCAQCRHAVLSACTGRHSTTLNKPISTIFSSFRWLTGRCEKRAMGASKSSSRRSRCDRQSYPTCEKMGGLSAKVWGNEAWRQSDADHQPAWLRPNTDPHGWCWPGHCRPSAANHRLTVIESSLSEAAKRCAAMPLSTYALHSSSVLK